jgi:hypothetical protein
MDADHARYVYSGMSLVDGRGYVTESGQLYYFRAPAYPLILGGAFLIAGGNGAHAAAWILGLLSLSLAIGMAARLGGWIAAVATTAAVVAVTQFWDQIVSLGIDLPQAAFYLAAVLLLSRPTPAYWLAAGSVMGIAILIKETVAPAVVLLPLAWLPVWTDLPWRRWVTLGLVFTLAVAIVAGWWWVYVWFGTGFVFPLNSLNAIVPDEAALSVSPTPLTLIVVVVGAAAWAYVLYRRFRDVGVRLLGFAALALVPAAATTVALAQPSRNFTGIVLLTCVAAGVALADLWQWISPRLSVRASQGVAVVAAAALAASIVIGQQSVSTVAKDSLPADTAAVLRPILHPGQLVISTFRYRSALGVELFNQDVRVRLIPVQAVQTSSDPSQFMWLGIRRGTLFGLTRGDWRRSLSSKDAVYLVVVAPHPLSPVELLPALRSSDGPKTGLKFVQRLQEPTGTADVFQITPNTVDPSSVIRLHAQPAALVQWLDAAVASGVTDASTALLAARPIVPAKGDGLANLSRRLGDAACFQAQQEGGRSVLFVMPATGQGDCVSRTQLEG